MIITLPFSLLGGALTGFSDDPAAALNAGSLVLSAIGGIIASTITLPFRAAVTVLVSALAHSSTDLFVAEKLTEEVPAVEETDRPPVPA